MKKSSLFCFFIFPLLLFGQGYNHNWLLGYDVALFDTNVTSTKAFLKFDTNTVTVTPANFKMPFRAGQGNISDANGNLLMVSNGCWIADATLDTMQNGSGLNPNPFTTSWCSNTSGNPLQHSNVFLPWPGDSSKYILFHETGTDGNNILPSYLYYSVINMNLNGGLGGVLPGQKNLIALQASLNVNLAACRHANGRDWWIIAFKDSSDIVYKFLLSPSGVSAPTQQSLGVMPYPVYALGQANFSPDGKKMAYLYYLPGGPLVVNYTLRLFDFDRCTGMFSNAQVISFPEYNPGLGLSFSSSSHNLYVCTARKIIQLNVDTSNVAASMDTVAVYDGYAFPDITSQTLFWMMYLAADGKIYISSGNSVLDFTFINYPDSDDLACDVQQHALHLPCYAGRSNVYHPNYYLGCDTTLGCPCLVTGINNLSQHDFRFRVYPNPIVNNSLHIGYQLPQNKPGVFLIYDVTGKVVFKYNLPQWSNEQVLNLPKLSDGVYQCIIKSNNFIATKKLIVIDEE